MILFYLITLLYGSNSLPLAFLSKNQTKTKTEHNDVLAEIKTNPQRFISEVQSLDPAALKQIISLLEELREKSEARENELITDLENKASALHDADQDVLKAEDAEDKANQAVTDAEGVLSGKQGEVTDAEGVLSGKQADAAEADQNLNDKKGIRKAKQTEKDVAQTAHDDEVPSLNEEQAVLANVMDIIQGLHDKHAGGKGIWDKSGTSSWQDKGSTRTDGAMGDAVGYGQCKSFKIVVSDCNQPVMVGVATDGFVSGEDCTTISLDTVWGKNVGSKSIQTFSNHVTLASDSKYHICSPAGTWNGEQTMDLCIDNKGSRCWNVKSSLGAVTAGLFPSDWDTVHPTVYNANSHCMYTISEVNTCNSCCESDCGVGETRGQADV